MEINKIVLSKDEISKIPEDERKFFLLASIFLNDIHHIFDLSRVVLLQKSENDIVNNHTTSQVIFFEHFIDWKAKRR